MEGYVKLWRKSLTNGWLSNGDLWRFWCYCLIKATYRERKTLVGYQQIELKPGEFIFGRRVAAKELRMSEQTIRTCLKHLKISENLTIKSTHQHSIISIVNWPIYQGGEDESNPPPNQQLTHSQPTANHRQEVKERKEGKEEKRKTSYGVFENVNLTEEEISKLREKFGEAGAQERIEALSAYIASKGKRYTSHYATILVWEKKNSTGKQEDIFDAWVRKSPKHKSDPEKAQ